MAAPRRSWIPWAVLVVVAVVIISTVGAVQLGAFRRVSAPEVSGVRADLASAEVGQAIRFTAAARDPGGGLLTYLWDFGDGTSLQIGDVETRPGISVVDHAYSLPGNFIVLVTVKNSAGGTTTNDNNLLFVTVQQLVLQPTLSPGMGGTPPAPSAVATVDNNVPLISTNVQFGAALSSQWFWVPATTDPKYTELNGTWKAGPDPISFYRWNFGDGSDEVGGPGISVVNHAYNRAGNWFAELTVGSESGLGRYGLTVRASNALLIPNPTTFNEVTFGEPQFLDPASDYETAGGEILLNVYETPVTYNGSSTTDLVPLLATQVPRQANGGISADGLTYNFKIRADVKFHNGDPLTAEDVAFSWRRPIFINDPEGPAWMLDLALFNYMVTNYLGSPTTDYTSSLTTVPGWLSTALAGHDTIDEGAVTAALKAAIFVNTTAGTPAGTVGVVTMRLVRPYPALIKIAAFTILDVVSKKFVEANGGDAFQTRNEFMVKNMMGTGPFKLRVWQPNQRIILDRWDQYWRTPAKLKQVNIIKVQDITTRELMLFAGQGDLAAIPRNHIYDVLDKASGKAKPGLLIDKDKPTFVVNFLGMNQKINLTNRAVVGDTFTNIPSKFFGDLHVRKAFSYAFDYDTFLSDVLFGGGLRSYGPIPDGMFGFSKTNLFNFDVAKATAELQAAQVIDKDVAGTAGAACATAINWYDCGFKIRIYYNAGNLVREQGSLLLKKGLESLNPGKIKVDVVALDWPVYLFTVSARKKAVALFFLGWAPDFADPDDYATPFMHSPPAGFFPSRVSFSDPALDDLIDKAAITVDDTARAQLYAQIQKISYEDDVPYIWTHQSVTLVVMKDWVKGFVSNPMTTANGMLIFYDLSKGR